MVISPKSTIRSRLVLAALAAVAVATTMTAGGCAKSSTATCSACDHRGPVTHTAMSPKGIPQVRSNN